MFNIKYQYDQEFYEEFEDDRLELEDRAILNELNKTFNMKGYTTADYLDYIEN